MMGAATAMLNDVKFYQLTVQSVREGAFHMPILFLPTSPAGESEVCPITHEPMGSPSYTVPYYQGSKKRRKKQAEEEGCPPVLSKHPHLQCAQIVECKHSFDARALMIHFLRNSMTCPLCRAGDPSIVMSASATFPREEWLLSIEKQIKRQNQPEVSRVIIHDSVLRSSVVVVSLFLYDTLEDEGQEPVHGMQFQMFLEPIARRHHDPAAVGPEGVLVALNELGVLPVNDILIEYQLDEDSLRYSLLPS